MDTAEPNLRTYFQVLRARIVWVVAAVVLCGAIAFAYTTSQKKEYSATAQLLIQPATAGALTGSQQSVSPTDVQTELQLLTSAPVKEKVRRQLGSEQTVAASQVGQTNVIDVTGTARTREQAAKIANAYANAFVTYQRATTIANLAAAEQQLQGQIDSIDTQVKAMQRSSGTSSQVAALLNQETVLKEQLAQLQVSGAVTTGGVEVVTPATPPTAPSSPKPVRNMLIALVVGLLLGVAIAFVVDNLDDAVYTREEAERLAGGAPVLAAIPKVNSRRGGQQVLPGSTHSRNSPVIEAYRSLRTSLEFAGHDGTLKTILVTSSMVGEGKTSTVANLGIVLAEAGRNVVMVSCDLRRPRLGELVKCPESPGLTSVILGQISLTDAVQRVPGVRNLSLLGSGQVPPNPADLIDSASAAQILSVLRSNYDLVLIDSPPLLPVTDAVVLARMADATLLVTAAGDTKRKELERASGMLAQVRAAGVAVVLNRVPLGGRYGYEYRYQSYEPSALPQAVSNSNGNGTGTGGARHRRSSAVPSSE